MNEITLTPRELPSLGIEAETITPDAFAGKELKEIKKLVVFYGNEEAAIRDFFQVQGVAAEKASDIRIIIEGNVALVKRIGQGMSAGEIKVKGNVGMYLGTEMRGGRIIIQGSIGPFAGQRMRGGELVIRGNAGNYLGSSYRGDWRGMRGGVITVEGNAGCENGEFMIGGKIHIKGNCGPFVGIHMKKGLIVIDGDAGDRVGAQMLSGNIIVNGKTGSMLPSFKFEGEEAEVSIDGDKFQGPFLKYRGDMAERRSKGRVYLRK